MKPLLLLPILFCSCATRIYENGLLAMETYADAEDFEYTKNRSGTTLKARTLIHSKHTQTGFDGVAKNISAGGAAAALLHP